MNIMLSRLHDCLFKDLIVPFMILKFRKLTLSFNCVKHLLDWPEIYFAKYHLFQYLQQHKETKLLISQIIVLF